MPAHIPVNGLALSEPPKGKRNDIGYLLNRWQRLAARSSPDKPESEDVADLALADVLIAACPLLEMYVPPQTERATPDGGPRPSAKRSSPAATYSLLTDPLRTCSFLSASFGISQYDTPVWRFPVCRKVHQLCCIYGVALI